MRRTHFLAYSLVLGLTACGGGGGDSSSGVGAGSTRSPVPPQTALTYGGSTTGATVSATSASAVTSNVVGASGAGMGASLLAGVSAQADSPTASGPQPTGATGLTKRLSRAIRDNEVARASNGGAVTAATLSQSIPCDSGTINLSGTVDNNGAGTVNIDYVDCRTGGDTLNGPGTLVIRSFDQTNHIITDGTLTFIQVHFFGPGADFNLGGTVDTQVSVGSATETITEHLVTKDNNTGHQTQIGTPGGQGLRFVNSYSTVTSPTFFTQSITGPVCESSLGCVDVSTTTAPFTSPWGPLYFATSSQDFPDWGIITLTGATGNVKVTSLGVDLAKLEVDANGDGIVDDTARLRWSELGTAVGNDLADSDGDGMPNSWEIAKGLNPNDPSDATSDRDGDGASAYTEYLYGTDPSTNGSVPTYIRHLWVTNVGDLAFDGTNIQVFTSGSSGVLLNPVTAELGATFPAGTPSGSGTTVTDAGGRSWTLAQVGSTTSWTITSNFGTSITLNNVGGTGATSLIRYGAHGLAFRTIGTASPGYIYLVDSAALVP